MQKLIVLKNMLSIRCRQNILDDSIWDEVDDVLGFVSGEMPEAQNASVLRSSALSW